jgi:DNA repair ATPase RecN
MTDYFALLGEARRPWLEPEKLKEKYFGLSRATAPDAEMNEAFRVLSDPKLRLHHLLTLAGADLTAGRPVPPSVAELFWNSGTLLREIERWLLRNQAAGSTLARALLQPERGKLEQRLGKLEEQLRAAYEAELAQLPRVEVDWPNELTQMVERYDSIAYLTRLLAQTAEKKFQLKAA